MNYGHQTEEHIVEGESISPADWAPGWVAGLPILSQQHRGQRGQVRLAPQGAGGAYASVGSWLLRGSTGWSLAWPEDYPPLPPPISQLGNLVHSPFPSSRRVGRGKDGGRDGICLGEKILYRDTAETPLPHSIINTSIKMGQVYFLLLSLQDWMQCMPEDRGMRKTKQRWRCHVWGAAEPGTLRNGSCSVFSTVLPKVRGTVCSILFSKNFTHYINSILLGWNPTLGGLN